MRAATRRLVGAVTLALLASSCSADTEATSTLSSTVENGRAATTAATPAAATVSGGGPKSVPVPGSPAGAVPASGFRDADLSPPGNALPLTFRIDPGCVEHGDSLAVTAQTKPGLYVAAQIAFPATDFADPPARRGTADKQGRLTWKLTVEPNSGEGEANLLASVRDPERDGPGSSGSWRFVVRAPGGCQNAG